MAIITTKIEKIGPQEAAAILKTNTRNRAPSSHTVAAIAADIRNGRYQFNGQPIIISDTGRLLDGQHRLMAIVAANASVQVMVVRGVLDASYPSIDCGRNRTASDVLDIEGVANTRTLAGALNILDEWEAGTPNTKTGKKSSYILELLRKYVGIEEMVTEARKHMRLRGSVLAAANWKLNSIRPEQAATFFRKLYSGADMQTGDPVLTLRNRLLSEKSMNGANTRWPYLSMIVMAWNAVTDGRQIVLLKAWYPGKGVPFPTPR